MSDQIRISVIIPTYNRLDALELTLLALAKQTLPSDQFEVILVDDGSTEDIPAMLQSLDLPYTFHFLQQSHRGPAAARNLGASQAQGDILLFLDSDMIAVPELLTQHLKSHTNPSRLMIGPRSCYTVGGKMRPYEEFDYRPDGTDPRLDKLPLSFQEVFTCNLSICQAGWQQIGGFDEQLSSFEDVEFAYRAEQSGMQIMLNPQALAYHNHALDFQERRSKAAAYARCAPLLFHKYPEMRSKILHLREKEPLNWKTDTPGLVIRKLIYNILAFKPILQWMEWLFPRFYCWQGFSQIAKFLYWKILSSYLWIGLRQGIRIYGWQ